MKRSVRTRFWLIFAVLALGPLFILGALVIRQSYVLGLRQAETGLMNTTRLASAKIERYLNTLNEHLLVFRDIAALRNGDRSQRDDILSMLVTHKHKGHASLFSEVRLVHPAGKILGCGALNKDCLNQKVLAETSFLDQSLPRLFNGRACFGPVFFEHQAGEPEMIIAVPVMDMRTGKPWAVLLARVRLKEIWTTITNIQPREGGLVFLMDDKGRIVAHPNPSVVLKGTSFDLPGGPVEGVVKGLHDDQVMMAVETIPMENQFFKVVTEKPVRAVLAPTYALIWKLGIVFALALCAVLLMGLASQRMIVNPLRMLALKARSLGAGDLDERVEMDRDDEFGELAEAFNLMARSLQQTISSLEQANRELSHFTFATSHHLQEPLRKVRTFGDRLKKRYAEALNEKGKNDIDRMQAATARMQQMLEDLLLFSRIRSDSLLIEPVDLTALANTVAASLKEKIQALGGTLHIGDLCVVNGDAFQLRVLLQHLMDNAFKFRRKDVPPVVRVTGGEKSGRLKLTVRDNGIGFDQKYLDRIFEPFQTLFGMDRYRGSGIGLAICRRIVESHGGRITASSTPGEGSRFLVEMPVKANAKPDQ